MLETYYEPHIIEFVAKRAKEEGFEHLMDQDLDCLIVIQGDSRGEAVENYLAETMPDLIDDLPSTRWLDLDYIESELAHENIKVYPIEKKFGYEYILIDWISAEGM